MHDARRKLISMDQLDEMDLNAEEIISAIFLACQALHGFSQISSLESNKW